MTVDIEDIQSDNSVLRADITVAAEPALLDPKTHTLKDDLTVGVTSVVNVSKRTWAKGTLPDVFAVSGTLSGDVADWPFDRYHSGPISIQLSAGAAQVPQRSTVILVDRLLGWKVDAAQVDNADSPASYQLNLRRTLSTAAFGVVIASVALYASSGTANRYTPEAPIASDGSAVTLNVEDVQSNYTVLNANLVFSPGSDLLDPQTQHLKEDLGIRVRSVATPTRRTWTKGMLPGMFPVPLTLAGEINDWPFDRYSSGPIEVELTRADAETAVQRVPVTFVNRLAGWELHTGNANGQGPYRVSLQRSLSAASFGLVIIGVLIAIACVALFVAVQTVRDRRKFQPPMTTWYAAMLFAVVPLRNALPGSPPFGGWIDITIVLWVLVVLVISMLLYIACWWRHLRPEAEKPTTPAASPSPAASPAPS